MPRQATPTPHAMPRLELDSEAEERYGFLESVVREMGELGLLTHEVLREDISRPLGHYTLEVIALSSESMREINLAHRGKDSSTDVLSFPLEIMELDSENVLGFSESSCEALPAPCLGSILINYDLALEVAKALGHSFEEEVSLLFVHGLLHILGFDHECDSGEQRALEQHIIQTLGLPKSLIVRTESETPR